MAVTLSLCWPRVRDVFPKLRKCKWYPHPFRRIPAAKLDRLAAIRMSGLLAIVHLHMNSRIEFQYKQKDIVTEYLLVVAQLYTRNYLLLWNLYDTYTDDSHPYVTLYSYNIYYFDVITRVSRCLN